VDGRNGRGEIVANENGDLYDNIRQATADIEQLSLLGRQLDIPVIVGTSSLLWALNAIDFNT